MRNLLMMVLLALPQMAYADMGDAGMDMAADMASDAAMDANLDASVDAALDADIDAAVDVGVDANMDAAVDSDTSADAGTDMADMAGDTANDMTGDDMAPDATIEFFTFSGTVVLEGAEDNGAVNVRVADSATNRQTFTDIAGLFEFTNLPASTYQVEVGFPGYISVVDSVELSADIARSYVLTPETTRVVRVDITFESTPPAEVVIDGSREMLTVTETVSVSGGAATWEPTLAEGMWNLNLSAAGYQTRQLLVDATKDGRQYNVLMTVEPTRDFTVSSDCGCSSIQTKRAMPIGFLIFLVGALIWRRRS